MKNKRGFTLVELLSVIVLLSLLMIISIPTYIDSSNSIKKSNLENTKKMLENTMLSFASIHYIDEIKPSGNDCSANNCCKYYSIEFIKTNQLFQSNDNSIINPVTGQEMTGYIKISYDTEQLSLVAEYKEDDSELGLCAKTD